MSVRSRLPLAAAISTTIAIAVLVVSRCLIVDVWEVGVCRGFWHHVRYHWPHAVVLGGAPVLHLAWFHSDSSMVGAFARPIVTFALGIGALALLILAPVDAQLGTPW